MNRGTSPIANSILPVLRRIDAAESQLLARLDRLGEIHQVERQMLTRLDWLDHKRAKREPHVSRPSPLTGPILASVVVLCALAVVAFVILR